MAVSPLLMGTGDTSISPLYGWSRVGERLRAKPPKNRGRNVTLLSSMSMEGMRSSVAVEGATTRAAFQSYVERALAPSLSPGQVVVMDDLSAHKGERVGELVEGRGCELVYLPPYSPDLNPIEQAFSKVKGLMRRAEARTREALVEAMGKALGASDRRASSGPVEFHRSLPEGRLLG